MFRILPFIICCLLSAAVYSQIRPGEGDILNYRLTGFSVPANDKAVAYHFEVSEYEILNNVETFINITRQQSDSNCTIIMLPSFGKQYAWRVTYINQKGKVLKTTPYYHFSTGTYVTIDSSKYRMLVIDTATHHDDIFIISDNISVIYDLKGNPVWYLPDVELLKQKDMQLRCLKPTKDGTFTAVSDLEAFELDYNGKIVWQAPNDGKVSGNAKESYHHEFTKLDNGHYMVAGFQSTMEKIPADYKLKPGMIQPGIIEERSDGLYRKTKSDNLIEYDKNKNVVWKWKSLEHFELKDFFRRSAKGINIEMHMNAFWFDQQNNVIYISFRNNNEIVKIEYPSGKILNKYGSNTDINDKGNNRLFYGQHNIIAANNRLYLFNNNSYNHIRTGEPEHKISHISVFEELPGGKLKNVWDFPCNIDTYADAYGVGGGSISLLDDGCILAGTGSASRAFIVSPEKKIVWNAVLQAVEGTNWTPLGPYRVNYITRKDLEKFIFR